jgi:hypothetical protein
VVTERNRPFSLKTIQGNCRSRLCAKQTVRTGSVLPRRFQY